MNFINFKNAVAKQFDLMCKQPELFRTTVPVASSTSS